MVAALTHQICTPLSSATLYAGHLQKFADKLVDHLVNIERKICDMLIVSRREIKLDEQVEAIYFLQELSVEGCEICDQKNLQLEIKGIGDSSNVWIQCNKEMLKGTLLNLFNNAIDSQSEGDAVVLCWHCDDAYVRFSFIDKGEGMSQFQLEHV